MKKTKKDKSMVVLCTIGVTLWSGIWILCIFLLCKIIKYVISAAELTNNNLYLITMISIVLLHFLSKTIPSIIEEGIEEIKKN